MKAPPIDIWSKGAVKLGDEVVCDGFVYGAGARVQTHIHLDHMHGFEESKGYQDIILSGPTRSLLLAELDADLVCRSNILAVTDGEEIQIGCSRVRLYPNGHMLGSVQVQVELANNGARLGYSSDFQWPLRDVIQVEALVIDSTCGSPLCVRQYTQSQAEARLLELVTSKLHDGPVHIKAHRGTLQRALQLLSSELDYPMVASPRLCREAQVYRDFGYPIGPLLSSRSAEGQDATDSARYIRFYGTGDKLPVEYSPGATIVTSAYMTRPDEPVQEYSERSFCVSLSNHADFFGTLEYVRATGAQYVLTDNSRGGHAFELASELRDRLNIEAVASIPKSTREWGT